MTHKHTLRDVFPVRISETWWDTWVEHDMVKWIAATHFSNSGRLLKSSRFS